MTKNQTHTHTFKPNESQTDPIQNVFLNLSQNSFSSNLMPLNLIDKTQSSVDLVSLERDLFACPADLTYMSYKDSLSSQSACFLDISSSYRLQGGGSVVPGNANKTCERHSSDNRNLNYTACVNAKISNIAKSPSANCSEGYEPISFEEVKKNVATYCNLLDQWDIARIGYKGSISGSGYGCKIQEWDEENELGNAICVQRSIDEIKLVAANETICPGKKKRTLVTLEEVLTDWKAYCRRVPYWGIARLAGGASLSGAGYMCQIKETDRESLGHALCAKASREQLDKADKKEKHHNTDDEEG